MRVAIVKNIIAPSAVPVMEDLARCAGVELLVVYERRTEPNRSWETPAHLDFSHVVLRSRTITVPRLAPDTYVHISQRPLRPLLDFRPEVVVASGGVWNSPLNVLSALTKQRHGWRFVPWWGQFLVPHEGPVSLRAVDRFKSWFVQRGDAWIAQSTRARDDAERLGADPTRIVVAPHAAAPGGVHRVKVRRERDTPFRFLYVGQLSPRKGIDGLLEAFAGLAGAELWLAGDGPLQHKVIEAQAADPRIRWLGFQGQPALDESFTQADALVLPSRYEAWGLVVNEALARGLPVVLSNNTGAADLVDDGITGVIAKGDGPDALRAAMEQVQHWTEAQFAHGREVASRRLLSYSPRDTSKAVLAACELALAAT
jgi:glycosyltransferase involved in cell wall biosynthesis